MAHRIHDTHHLRDATTYLSDDQTVQSERALAAIASGDYKGVHSRESGDGAPTKASLPRGLAVQDSADPRNAPGPTSAMVRQSLERTRVIPRVLTVPCPAGHADAGTPCYQTAVAVCWQRVIARAARP